MAAELGGSPKKESNDLVRPCSTVLGKLGEKEGAQSAKIWSKIDQKESSIVKKGEKGGEGVPKAAKNQVCLQLNKPHPKKRKRNHETFRGPNFENLRNL